MIEFNRVSSIIVSMSTSKAHSIHVKPQPVKWSSKDTADPSSAVSSVSALVGGGFQTHYTPTKAAILSMMQSMAISLGDDKIRCNALLPGTSQHAIGSSRYGESHENGYAGSYICRIRWAGWQVRRYFWRVRR